jgi:hypothetical protein
MTKLLRSACCIGILALSSQVFAENVQSGNPDQSSFTGWMGGYATQNNGRITRKAYMDEAGRRWDAMDRDRQGLTIDQIHRMYGYGPVPTNSVDSAPGRAGTAPKGG